MAVSVSTDGPCNVSSTHSHQTFVTGKAAGFAGAASIPAALPVTVLADKPPIANREVEVSIPHQRWGLSKS